MYFGNCWNEEVQQLLLGQAHTASKSWRAGEEEKRHQVLISEAMSLGFVLAQLKQYISLQTLVLGYNTHTLSLTTSQPLSLQYSSKKLEILSASSHFFRVVRIPCPRSKTWLCSSWLWWLWPSGRRFQFCGSRIESRRELGFDFGGFRSCIVIDLCLWISGEYCVSCIVTETDYSARAYLSSSTWSRQFGRRTTINPLCWFTFLHFYFSVQSSALFGLFLIALIRCFWFSDKILNRRVIRAVCLCLCEKGLCRFKTGWKRALNRYNLHMRIVRYVRLFIKFIKNIFESRS